MATVFAQMFDDKTNVFQISNARVRMAKLKEFRMILYQSSSTLHQFRRSWSGWRILSQFIRCLCHGLKLTRRICGIKHGHRWLTILLREDAASLNSIPMRATPQVELA